MCTSGARFLVGLSTEAGEVLELLGAEAADEEAAWDVFLGSFEGLWPTFEGLGFRAILE